MRIVCAIYDVRAESFSDPIFVPHRAHALRSFESAVNEKGTDFNRYPSDYKLVMLGTYDEVRGKFDVQEHVTLAVAADLMRSSSEV